MEAFLRYLVENLVGATEGVEIAVRQDPGKTVCELHLPRRDVGKIIGKQGRTIEAVRNLLNAAAARRGEKALLQIVEER